MAAKTTAANGNWSAGATWTGGTKPAAGDTVTINHNVTVDENFDIGDSGVSAAVAMVVATGKTLTVNNDLDLILRGGIQQNGTGFIDIGAGVDWFFNTANCGTPSTVFWIWQIGDGHNNNCRVRVRGTISNRTAIRSASGGGSAYTTDGTGPWLQAGLFDAEYCDFTRIGDATRAAFKLSPTSTTTARFYRCNFDTCGAMDGTYNIGADCTYQLIECSWKNTQHADKCLRLNNTNAKTGGTREILDCVFDKFCELYQPKDFTIQRNYFNSAFGTTNGDWTATDGFKNNFVRIPTGAYSVIIAGSTKQNFWFFDNPTEYNPHFIECLNYDRSLTIDGDIFDCSCDVSSPAQEGDCIMLDDSTGVSSTVTIQNVIVVKGPSNRTVGTLCSCLGNANTFVDAYHCTVHTGTQGFAVGETYAGHASMALVKSCIFWDETGSQGYKVYDVGSNENVVDLAAAADLNYNCGYNLLAGSNLKGYNNLEFSSGSPGANDITQNPDFVNKNATLKTWDAQNGGPGTVAGALGELRKRNDSDFDVNYTVPNLVQYIRSAFMPQNQALKNAAHDGGDIGAVTITGGGSGGSAGKYRALMGVG